MASGNCAPIPRKYRLRQITCRMRGDANTAAAAPSAARGAPASENTAAKAPTAATPLPRNSYRLPLFETLLARTILKAAEA